MMDLTQIIGFLAGFSTTFAALPDLIAMLKRRSSVGIGSHHGHVSNSQG
jgi:MtN3 and saliva related transmembrane protein